MSSFATLPTVKGQAQYGWEVSTVTATRAAFAHVGKTALVLAAVILSIGAQADGCQAAQGVTPKMLA
jgi:hypothetical protein